MTDLSQPPRVGTPLAVVFGSPGRKTMAMCDAIQAIIQCALGEYVLVEMNSLQQWDQACSAGKHFLAVSQYPWPEVFERVEQESVPAIIVVDNPLLSAVHLVEEGQPNANAVRAASASISCLADWLVQDASTISCLNERNLEILVSRLGEISGLKETDSTFNHSVSECRELAGALVDTCELPLAAERPLGDLFKLADPVLSHLCGTGEAASVWPGYLFFLGDSPDTPMQAAVELAGPARCLLYGPYMHLPSGSWSALLKIGLSGHREDQSFTVEVVCAEVVARGRFCCPGSGLFEVQIDFAHHVPQSAIELRLFLEVGTIYGSLQNFEVKLKSNRAP